MNVVLNIVELSAEAVGYTAWVARHVARHCRRRDHDRPIHAVTDDIGLVRYLAPGLRHYDETLLGCTYHRVDGGTVVWLNPDSSQRQCTRTLNHELAHALGRRGVSHSASFRRLHVVLLPFTGIVLGQRFDLAEEARRVVGRYAYRGPRHGDILRREALRDDEAYGHREVAARVYRRLASELIGRPVGGDHEMGEMRDDDHH